MKHPLWLLLLSALMLTSCPAEKKEEPQANIALPALAKPAVKELASNKLVQAFLQDKYGKLRFLTMYKNHFVLITTDSLTTETAYITDTNFTSVKKIYTNKESKPMYALFSGSLYTFPLYKNYCVNIFDNKDTLYNKSLPSS